ncbi:MAG: hypothetical protein ABJE47_14460 [bacterium]
MSTGTLSMANQDRSALSRYMLAGAATGVSDAIFATVFNAVRTGSLDLLRVWQGVASVLIGKSALTGGASSALLGLAMHFCVAYFWTAVFLVLIRQSHWLRGIIDSRLGALKVASVLGPVIWLIMDLVVIPALVHRPPVIALPFYLMGIGHIFFVGLPITSIIGNGSK